MAEKGHTGYRAIRAITIHKRGLKGILLAHIANIVEFIDIKTQAIHPKSYESFISTGNRQQAFEGECWHTLSSILYNAESHGHLSQRKRPCVVMFDVALLTSYQAATSPDYNGR